MYIESRNSLSFLGGPCAGCFHSICIKVASFGDMNIWIWRTNRNKWKYVKRSIFCKFARFGFQLYYHRAPSQLFRKDKGYKLNNFLRIFKATTFETISHISHISSQKEDSCPANNFMFKGNGIKTREVVKCV